MERLFIEVLDKDNNLHYLYLDIENEYVESFIKFFSGYCLQEDVTENINEFNFRSNCIFKLEDETSDDYAYKIVYIDKHYSEVIKYIESDSIEIIHDIFQLFIEKGVKYTSEVIQIEFLMYQLSNDNYVFNFPYDKLIQNNGSIYKIVDNNFTKIQTNPNITFDDVLKSLFKDTAIEFLHSEKDYNLTYISSGCEIHHLYFNINGQLNSFEINTKQNTVYYYFEQKEPQSLFESILPLALSVASETIGFDMCNIHPILNYEMDNDISEIIEPKKPAFLNI